MTNFKTRLLKHLQRLAPVVGSLALTLTATLASADTIQVGTLTYDKAKVTDIRNGEIYFTTQNNTEVHKSFDQVKKIVLDGEAAFNGAEDAYAASDWVKATDGYLKTFQATQKPWLKNLTSVRLLDTASKTDRFDAAVTAYIFLVEKDPESAKSVALTMPKAESTYLTDAINKVKTASGRAQKPEQKKALLDLLMKLAEAKGDAASMDAAIGELSKADPNDPLVKRSAVRKLLTTARADLTAKKYDAVVQAVDKQADQITDPADQAEALFLYAEAVAGKASSPADWNEAVLAYMRVAANFNATAPQVPQALLKVAGITETKLNEKGTAVKLYTQIADEYKGQPAGAEADQHLKRLKGS